MENASRRVDGVYNTLMYAVLVVAISGAASAVAIAVILAASS